MANEVILNAGAGGAHVSTKTVGSQELPRSLLIVGDDNTDVTSINPLPIYQSVTPIITAGQVTLVAANVETTIATYVGEMYVSSIVATGDVHAEYKLYSGATFLCGGRTSVANPTLTLYFGLATPFIPISVTLKVQHFENAVNGNFIGTIFGFSRG